MSRIFGLTLILLAACGSRTPPSKLCPSRSCQTSLSCPGGHACVDGQCVLPCSSVSDCPKGATKCIKPEERAPDDEKLCVDIDGVPGQACSVDH